MPYDSMRIKRDGGLARLTFTEAGRGNPIDGTFCAEFCDVANLLSSDSSVRVLLIDAEGGNFSFGGDIAMFLQNLAELPLQIRRWTADLHAGVSRLQRMDAPMVAAVQGVCAGGMAGIVAGADIVVAETATRFVSAYAGIGYCCDAGSSVMLHRRLGPARARRFLLLNETMNAGAALEAGLADEVVATADLSARAEAIARQLAAGPTIAFGAIRRLLATAGSNPLDTQLELEAQALAGVSGTADAREGLMAFAAKRKAVFQGQ